MLLQPSSDASRNTGEPAGHGGGNQPGKGPSGAVQALRAAHCQKARLPDGGAQPLAAGRRQRLGCFALGGGPGHLQGQHRGVRGERKNIVQCNSTGHQRASREASSRAFKSS